MNFTCLTLFLIIILTLEQTTAEKNRTLDVLVNTLPVARMCNQAFKATAEWVNNNTLILPKYKLRMIIEDEGFLGSNVPKNIVKFTQLYDNNDSYQASPISVGPFYSPGCSAGGKIAHQIDHVMLSIGCTASKLNDRNVYPNLFLTSSTLNPKAYGMVRFMKEIGGWNKFAMYVNIFNANDFDLAKVFYQIAIDNGMEVLIFDSISDFDYEDALALKESQARVIVVWDSQLVFDIYCQTWAAGIKGERYVFITTDKYPILTRINCTGLQQQYENVIMLAVNSISNNEAIVGEFGYTREEFDLFFEQYLQQNGVALLAKEQGDYRWRIPCNDMVMHLVKILDESEKALKAMNLSIDDYNRNRSQVMKVIYNEALNVEYSALKGDRISYSDTQEPAGLPQYILTFNKNAIKNGDFIPEYKVRIDKTTGSPTFNYSSYHLTQVGGIDWGTKDGKPPKDFWTVKEIKITINNQFRIAIIVVSILLTFSQIVVLIVAIVKFEVCKNEKILSNLKIISICSCFLFNISAILFSFDFNETGRPIVWYLQIIALTMSFLLSMFGSVLPLLVAKAVVKAVVKTSNQRSTAKSQTKSSKSTFSNVRRKMAKTAQEPPSFKKLERKCLFVGLVCLSVTVAIDLGWFFADPPVCLLEMPNQPVYYEKSDTLVKSFVMICKSEYQTIWTLAFSFLYLFIFSSGLLAALLLKQSKQDKQFPTFLQMSAIVANSEALLVAAILVLLTLNDSVPQRMAVSIISLLISLILSSISFQAILKSK